MHRPALKANSSRLEALSGIANPIIVLHVAAPVSGFMSFQSSHRLTDWVILARQTSTPSRLCVSEPERRAVGAGRPAATPWQGCRPRT